MGERIGFIGLGIMGKPMARNLLAAGFPVAVHSRGQGPVDEVVAAGAVRADGPASVAAAATSRSRCCPTRPTSSRSSWARAA